MPDNARSDESQQFLYNNTLLYATTTVIGIITLYIVFRWHLRRVGDGDKQQLELNVHGDSD